MHNGTQTPFLMNPFILNIDTVKYVYMFDIYEPRCIFALERTEYGKFVDMYNEYLYFKDVFQMPETCTVMVLPLVEVRENVYELRDLNPISYPVKRIYNAIASRANETV